MKIQSELTSTGLEELLRFLHGNDNRDITFANSESMPEYFGLDSASPIRTANPSRTVGFGVEIITLNKPVPSGVYNKLIALVREYSSEVEPKEMVTKFQ